MLQFRGWEKVSAEEAPLAAGCDLLKLAICFLMGERKREIETGERDNEREKEREKRKEKVKEKEIERERKKMCVCAAVIRI